MDALGALGIALAGGSVGSVVILAAGVPEQVRHHDRLVGDYDADLGQWVADECVRLEREETRHKNSMAAQGQLDSGAYVRGLAHLREECLHRYRDQEAAAQQRRNALRDAEGWRHWTWRRLTRRGALPDLATPERARPILDAWRGKVDVEQGSAPVSDPTQRSLDWAIKKYGLPD